MADWLVAEIEARELDAIVERSVCFGYCLVGPNVRELREEFIHEASEAKLTALLDATPRPKTDRS